MDYSESILGKRNKCIVHFDEYTITKWWIIDKMLKNKTNISIIDNFNFLEQTQDYCNFLGVGTNFKFSNLVTDILKQQPSDRTCFYYAGNDFTKSSIISDCETRIICTPEENIYENQYYQLWEPDIVMWSIEKLNMELTYSLVFNNLIPNVDYGDTIIIDNRMQKIWKLKNDEDCCYIN